MGKGKFFAFEGIDGSGKSTQIKLLAERLNDRGIKSYITKEPTQGPAGALAHQIMTGRLTAHERVTAALFAADRLDHLLNTADGLAVKVEQGVTVLTDRYYMSNYAYNGVFMPIQSVIDANRDCAAILRPSFNIFIDVDPAKAMERVAKNRFHKELYESTEQLTKVRAKYFEAFELLKSEERVLIIDGEQAVEKIAEDIWNGVKELF